MTYADPELLFAEWTSRTLDVKTWADPVLPPRWDFNSPIAHIQRTPGDGDLRLTLDSAIVDVDVYAALSDNAREVAELIRRAARVDFPGHTTADGVFVKAVETVMAPVWLPDPNVFRRSATYRFVLHSPL